MRRVVFAIQTYNVASLIPICRQKSATAVPPSACLGAKANCPSVNRERFIVPLSCGLPAAPWRTSNTAFLKIVGMPSGRSFTFGFRTFLYLAGLRKGYGTFRANPSY
jgi:hypothetical protein